MAETRDPANWRLPLYAAVAAAAQFTLWTVFAETLYYALPLLATFVVGGVAWGLLFGFAVAAARRVTLCRSCVVGGATALASLIASLLGYWLANAIWYDRTAIMLKAPPLCGVVVMLSGAALGYAVDFCFRLRREPSPFLFLAAGLVAGVAATAIGVLPAHAGIPGDVVFAGGVFPSSGMNSSLADAAVGGLAWSAVWGLCTFPAIFAGLKLGKCFCLTTESNATSG